MFSWESFYVICALLIVPPVNQHQCKKKHHQRHQSAQWPLVPLSFTRCPFSHLVWMYINTTPGCPEWMCIRFTVSWKPQFDLGGHLGDVESMIHTQEQKPAEVRGRLSWNKQAAAQPSATEGFWKLLYHKGTQSALRLLLWVVLRTRKHTSFTRRGDVCMLAWPLSRCMCVLVYPRVRSYWACLYGTESVHNLGRTNNYFMSISNFFLGFHLQKRAWEELDNAGSWGTFSSVSLLLPTNRGLRLSNQPQRIHWLTHTWVQWVTFMHTYAYKHVWYSLAEKRLLLVEDNH